MVELPPEAVGVAIIGWAGKTVFAPLLDEMGRDLAERYSERRRRNTARILANAAEKLGGTLENGGYVSPRVGKLVLDEGSWCDAPVMSEYFGGILAASRSDDGLDDRGAAWAGLVSRLASYDILVHYVIYAGIRQANLGKDLRLGRNPDREQARTYFPFQLDGVTTAMEAIAASGHDDLSALGTIAASLESLVREGLIDGDFTLGRADVASALGIDADGIGGFAVKPSVSGVQLFLWAHGYGQPITTAFLDPAVPFEAVEDLPEVDAAYSVAAMQKEMAQRLRVERHPESS